METAQNQVEVDLTPEEAHERWLAFTGGAGQADGQHATVDGDDVIGQDGVDDKGQVAFHDLGDGRTRVTMELRYNPAALADADLDADWIGRRIGMYLERYRAEATA